MYRGWRRNLYVIWLATFASVGGSNLAQPFLPLFIYQELGAADPASAAIWTGISAAGGGLAMAVMAPVWGVLADRHGRKPMLVRAQFAMGTANLLLSTVGSPWQLVALRSVQGFFSGVVGASRALVAGSVPRDRLPYAMGVIQSAIFVGQTLGPTIGGILGSTLGFRAAFIATGCINVVAGALALKFVRERSTTRAKARAPGGLAAFRILAESRPLATMMLVTFVVGVANQAVRPILPLFLHEIDPAHDVAFTAGLAFAVLGISGTVAAVLVGRSAGRVSLRLLVGGSALGASLTTLATLLANSPFTVLAVLFLVGLAQGALATTSTALLGLYAPGNRQGTVFGLLTSVQSLSSASGPLLGGVVASFADLRAPFVATGLLFLVGVALVATLPSTTTTAEPESATP